MPRLHHLDGAERARGAKHAGAVHRLCGGGQQVIAHTTHAHRGQTRGTVGRVGEGAGRARQALGVPWSIETWHTRFALVPCHVTACAWRAGHAAAGCGLFAFSAFVWFFADGAHDSDALAAEDLTVRATVVASIKHRTLQSLYVELLQGGQGGISIGT